MEVRLKVDWFDRELTEKDLLEVLEKIYYGTDSQFPLSACYDVVVAFIEKLRKEIKNEND